MIKTLLKIISKEQFCFMDANDLSTLEAEMPNLPVLLRFGSCRKQVDAYRAKTEIENQEAYGTYLRDVSISSQVLTEMAQSPFVPLSVKEAIESIRA
jgi:hypothetical protein